MNLYFEFPESQVGKRYSLFGATIPAKYCVRHCATAPGGPLFPHRLMHSAERIWQEDENSIKFIKNRYSHAESTPVDMKELVWVALQAVTI